MACVAFTLVFLGVCRLPVSHFWRESVVMEMGSLTHFKVTDKRFKQTSYFKDFKRESLYIRWVNDKIWLLLKDITKAYDGENTYEDVFCGDKAKDLTSIFQNFLNVKTISNFRHFNDIKFGLSSVDRIIQLKVELYHLICENLHIDFVVGDDEFQDFFEEFITFTRRIFLKNEEDYENDIFDINEYRGYDIESDDDFIFPSDSDCDSESESESD